MNQNDDRNHNNVILAEIAAVAIASLIMETEDAKLKVNDLVV